MKYATQTKHGLRKTRFYRIYGAAKARCENPNSDSYIRYGARGIKFEFKNFEEFRDALYEDYLAHAKLHTEKDTTIDRIDTNGNYSTANCRWATMREQACTRRHSISRELPIGVKSVNRRWAASRTLNGKQRYLGMFNSPQEAHQAYLTAV